MNKKTLCSLLLLSLAEGCLSPAPPAPTYWTIEWRPGGRSAPEASGKRPAPAVECLPCTLRVADVLVRAPYGGTKLAVLRGDGSLAFDAYNVFAAAPEQLLRGAAFDALERSGRFEHVTDRASLARADVEAEVTVTRLALDCREADRRNALVELSLSFVAKDRVIAVAPGHAAVPVGDGDYSDGFSRAFSDALTEAARALKSDAVR